MAKAVNKKTFKTTAKEYDEKLAIKGMFADMFQVVKKIKKKRKKYKCY